MQLNTKIILNNVSTTLLTYLIMFVSITLILDHYNHSIARKSAERKLRIVNNAKSYEITNYFQNINKQLKILIEEPIVSEATSEFILGFHSYAEQVKNIPNKKTIDAKNISYLEEFNNIFAEKNDGLKLGISQLHSLLNEQQLELQYNYISSSPYGFNQEYKINFVDDGTDYSIAHKKYHPYFVDLYKTYEYHDILLLDLDGNIVYSVYKDFDFSDNVLAKDFAQPEMAELFIKEINNKDRYKVSFNDYSNVFFSFYEPLALFANSIYDKNGKKIGIAIIKIGQENLEKILSSNKNWQELGLGSTGEINIIGPNGFYRNNTRLMQDQPNTYLDLINNPDLVTPNLYQIIKLKRSTMLNMPATFPIEELIEQDELFLSTTNILGNKILSIGKKIEILDHSWVVTTNMEYSEFMQPYDKQKNTIKLYLYALGLILLFTTIFITQRQTNTIYKELNELLKELNEIATTKNISLKIKTSNKLSDLNKIAQEINYLLSEINKALDSSVKISSEENSNLSSRVKEIAKEFGVIQKEKINKSNYW